MKVDMTITTIHQNVTDRVIAESLFTSMLDAARDDYRALSDHGKRCFIEKGLEYFAGRLGVEVQGERQVTGKLPHIEQVQEVADAIEELQTIIEMCEEIPDNGADFAKSVSDSAASMIETIERLGSVTEKQLTAIENWRAGVERWVR